MGFLFSTYRLGSRAASAALSCKIKIFDNIELIKVKLVPMDYDLKQRKQKLKPLVLA